MIVCLLAAFSSCNRVSDSSRELQSPHVIRETSPAEHKLVLPPCPRSSYPMLLRTPETGQVRALATLALAAAKWDWTNRICFLQR
jgi:hypothetical protein